MTCPYCESPSYVIAQRTRRVREDWLGRLLSALLGRPIHRQDGNIVACARCLSQFRLSLSGSQKIRSVEPPPANAASEQKDVARTAADSDIPWKDDD